MKKIFTLSAMLLLGAVLFMSCDSGTTIEDSKIIATYSADSLRDGLTGHPGKFYNERFHVFDSGRIIYSIEVTDNDEDNTTYYFEMNLDYSGSIPNDLSFEVSEAPSFSKSHNADEKEAKAWFAANYPCVNNFKEGKKGTLKAYNYGAGNEGYYSLFMKTANGYTADRLLMLEEN